MPNLGSEFLVAFLDQMGKFRDMFSFHFISGRPWMYHSLQKHTRQHLNHFIIVPPNWHLQVEAFDTKKSKLSRGLNSRSKTLFLVFLEVLVTAVLFSDVI